MAVSTVAVGVAQGIKPSAAGPLVPTGSGQEPKAGPPPELGRGPGRGLQAPWGSRGCGWRWWCSWLCLAPAPTLPSVQRGPCVPAQSAPNPVPGGQARVAGAGHSSARRLQTGGGRLALVPAPCLSCVSGKHSLGAAFLRTPRAHNGFRRGTHSASPGANNSVSAANVHILSSCVIIFIASCGKWPLQLSGSCLK